MLFNVLKRAIERKNYNSVEDMKEKISILFVGNQLTNEQFEMLMAMLEE